MSILLLAAAFVMLVWLLGPPILIDHHRVMPILPAEPARTLPDPAPLLSVIVPARDEAERIAGCVRSVLSQDHPRFELVVVDDRSSDGTAEIVAAIAAEDARLTLVRGAECPPGWAGKNHALVQGVAASTGEHVLLLDADVELRAGCLREAHALALETGAGLTTVLLGTTFRGFWERVLQPLMYELMMFAIPPDRVNDPAFPDVAMAPGPFLLFSRAAYDAIGGHAAMRGEIVEDLALAKRSKAEGHGLVLADGTRLTHLARDVDFDRLWEGWSRVTFKGIEQSLWTALGGVAGILIGLLGPWLAVPAGVVLAWTGDATLPGVLLAVFGAVAVLAQVACRFLLDLYYGIDRSTVWLTPVAAAVAMAVIVNSALLSFGRTRVEWKGRVYDHQH